jgi:hypothetical protein
MPFSEDLNGIFLLAVVNLGQGVNLRVMLNDALHFLVETQEAPDWERLGQIYPMNGEGRQSLTRAGKYSSAPMTSRASCLADRRLSALPSSIHRRGGRRA